MNHTYRIALLSFAHVLLSPQIIGASPPEHFCSLPSLPGNGESGGTGSQPAALQKPTRESVSLLLKKLRKESDLPAMGVAILTAKGVQILEVDGVRKRGDATPVSVNDPFHLGSDTKAFTSALIGILVEQGKLSWDLTLEKAFPELKEKMVEEVKSITLQHLLTHTSGFPGAPKEGWWFQYGKGTVQERRLKVVEEVTTRKPLHKPGSKYVYSNLNYVVAAAMVEQVSKESWENLMKKKVFAPLKITTGGFGPIGNLNDVNQPWSHDKEGKAVEPTFKADNPPVSGPSGRIHCSLPDWSRFVLDQLRGSQGKNGLLKAETYKTLHSRTGSTGTYVVGGWLRVEGGAGAVLGHDGTNTLNFATAWIALERDVAVLVVCNQGGDKAKQASRKLSLDLLKAWILGR